MEQRERVRTFRWDEMEKEPVVEGIDDLTDLPGRYRQMGVHVGSQMGELRAPRDGRSRGILGPLIALARAAFGARDLLSPLTVATAALRPMLLLGALIAAMIALVEIPAAGVILLLVIV